MQKKKNSGYENIIPRIIKKVSNAISEPLAHKFNLTFHNGAIPEKLKIAPIHKSKLMNLKTIDPYFY